MRLGVNRISMLSLFGLAGPLMAAGSVAAATSTANPPSLPNVGSIREVVDVHRFCFEVVQRAHQITKDEVSAHPEVLVFTRTVLTDDSLGPCRGYRLTRTQSEEVKRYFMTAAERTPEKFRGSYIRILDRWSA